MLKVFFSSTALLLTLRLTCKADFREDLAKQLNADPKYLVLNLPPKGGAWPGTIYTGSKRFVVSATSKNRTLVTGPRYNFSQSVRLDLSANAGAAMVSVFNVRAEVAAISDTLLHVKNARAYEITYDTTKKVLKDAQLKIKDPFVIHRSYEGELSLELTKKKGGSADGWVAAVKRFLDVGAKVAGKTSETLTLSAAQPFVFAYEVTQPTELARRCMPPHELDCESSTSS